MDIDQETSTLEIEERSTGLVTQETSTGTEKSVSLERSTVPAEILTEDTLSEAEQRQLKADLIPHKLAASLSPLRVEIGNQRSTSRRRFLRHMALLAYVEKKEANETAFHQMSTEVEGVLKLMEEGIISETFTREEVNYARSCWKPRTDADTDSVPKPEPAGSSFLRQLSETFPQGRILRHITAKRKEVGGVGPHRPNIEQVSHKSLKDLAPTASSAKSVPSKRSAPVPMKENPAKRAKRTGKLPVPDTSLSTNSDTGGKGVANVTRKFSSGKSTHADETNTVNNNTITLPKPPTSTNRTKPRHRMSGKGKGANKMVRQYPSNSTKGIIIPFTPVQDGLYGTIIRSPKFRPKIRTPHALREMISDTIIQVNQKIYKKVNGSLWNFPKDKEHFDTYSHRMERALNSIIDRRTNIHKTFWEKLKVPGYVFRNSDKNLGIVCIHEETLIDKERTFLSKSGKFEQLSIEEYQERNKETMRKLLRLNIKSGGRKDAIFYGIPKVHKYPWTIRPIVAAPNIPVTELSKQIATTVNIWLLKLKELSLSHVVQNTTELLLKIEEFKSIIQSKGQEWNRVHSQDMFIESADFSDLYTNLKKEDIVAAINQIGPILEMNPLVVQRTSNMVTTLLDSTTFTYHDEYWQQTDGIPMGTNCGPALANLTLLKDMLLPYFNEDTEKLPFFISRYIDDVLFIGFNRRTWENKIKVLFPEYLKLNIESMAQVSGACHFLDVEIHIPSLDTTLYRKPCFNWNYLDSKSKHPRHTLNAWARTEFMRIYRICSTRQFYLTNAIAFQNALRRLGYNKRQSTFPTWTSHDRIYILNKKIKRKKTSDIWIPFPFEMRGTLVKLHTILRYFLPKEYQNIELNEATTLDDPLLKILSRR